MSKRESAFSGLNQTIPNPTPGDIWRHRGSGGLVCVLSVAGIVVKYEKESGRSNETDLRSFKCAFRPYRGDARLFEHRQQMGLKET